LLSAVARAETPAGNSRGLLFLDTETTGLAGGTGTYTFLVGVGRLDGDRFIVEQYFMRDFDEEPALLAALVPLLEQAAGVVTFNGSAFDLPLLETRFVLARRRWPPRLPHLDLLRPARRVFAPRCAACRLATLERGVLGLEGGDLAGPTAHRVRLRLARWEKRAARWDRACALWEVAARHGAFDREPWEELAKFHEHRRRDLPTARATVSQALELADLAGAPPG